MKPQSFIQLLLLLPLLWTDGVWARQCAEYNYDLRSQAAVDALGQTGCTFVSGFLRIQGSTDITNLGKLTGITTVNNLEIVYNDSLANLDGLGNLTSVLGDLTIMANAVLNDVDGLNNLTQVGGSFFIELNPALTDLDGLSNLTSVEGELDIRTNDNLINLDGLSGLKSVAYLSLIENYGLSNIDGLRNLTSSEGGLHIQLNDSLFDCKGIVQLLEGFRGKLTLDSEQYIAVNLNATGCNSVMEILDK